MTSSSAEGVERALHDGGQAMAAVAESPHDPLAAVIDAYLSTTHRDNLASSCAVTTLAADVARSNPQARAAYTSQVGVYIEMLVRLLPPGPTDRRRATAITALSTLVGAVSMARAVDDEALSREILASAAVGAEGTASLKPGDCIGRVAATEGWGGRRDSNAHSFRDPNDGVPVKAVERVPRQGVSESCAERPNGSVSTDPPPATLGS